MKEGLGNTEMNSTTGFGDTGSKEAAIWVTGSVRAEAGLYDKANRVRSTSIDNATTLYGRNIKAGSVLTGNSTPASGIITFADSFSDANYFMQLTPRDMSGMYRSNAAGSFVSPLVSGIRHASGCWVVAGSATVVDWMAVGI